MLVGLIEMHVRVNAVQFLDILVGTSVRVLRRQVAVVTGYDVSYFFQLYFVEWHPAAFHFCFFLTVICFPCVTVGLKIASLCFAVIALCHLTKKYV